MAETWGDIIGRNYGTGRAIGDDFARTRFERRAQKVKDEYQQKADAEGKTLQDYLPDIERDLEQLAVKVGATRRAIKGRGGEALDQSYARGLREGVALAGERRAGAKAMAGDQAGARQSRAGTQYAIGEFDAGQGQQIAGDTIAATQGAMRPDGTYDMAAGAQALAGVGAKYGSADAANAQQQGATSFRLQAARAKADALFNMAQNPAEFTEDQFAGAWEGLKQNVPELAHHDLRKGPDNVLYMYTNGKPTGSFDPKNQTDVKELAAIMTQFTKAPGESLAGYNAARLKAIEDEKAQGNEFSGKIDDAMIKVITEGKQYGIPDAMLTKLTSAGSGSGESKGWQLQELGDEPGTYMMQKGGKVYTIKTNTAPNLETGEVGGTLQVFDSNGKPVNPAMLDEGTRAGFDYTMSLVNEMASMGDRRAAEWMKGQLSLLGSLRNQRFGLSSPGPSAGGGGTGGDGQRISPVNLSGMGNESAPGGFTIGADIPPDVADAIRAAEAQGQKYGPATPAGAPPASAPPAQTSLPRKAAISRETVAERGQNLLRLRDEYLAKRDALERFEADFKPETSQTLTGFRGGAMPSRRYQSAEQQQVGDRLRAEVAELEKQLREATGDVRRSTGALRRQGESASTKAKADDLYNSYSGGTADFFRAADR